ncbi:MAG: site-specific DNA-methyltransferase [Lachnospiraceae bacterium]|nr:site-specific DNA-methyltransferase [Lachnospiraceae bacterium]
MDKLKMQTVNNADENYRKLAEMFPNAVTETIDENGEVVRAIDKDVLMQEISCKVVEGREERYQFTWPDKKKSVLLANAPINKTLRPCREESVDFDNTENLYIEGDNLEVLKLLQETYLGKVKMIYIDPPYNTGSDFVYEDDFAQSVDEYLANSGQFDEEGNKLLKNLDSNGRFHTDWLNMIYPRLKLAKDLLSDDGVIFISIDDNEVDNLRKCCGELFGDQNFIAHIIHKNNSMKNQSKYVGVSTEFVLIYAKNIVELNNRQPAWRCKKKGAAEINATFKKMKDSGLSLTEIREEIAELYSRPKYAHLSRWNKVDEYGIFMDSDLSRSNGPKDFTIINPYTGKECLIPNRGWGKSKEELLKLQKENLIWYGDDTTPPRMKSYLTDESESVFDNFFFADTSIDKKSIDKMFGSQVFEFPKSLEMLKQIISLCSEENSVIFDFFSGSATTAHAVMQLNAEDGGNRKFIMVQLPEETDEKSEAYKAGYKNICEIGKERIRRAGQKIKEESPLTTQNLDIGFRVLKCDTSNMKDVYYNPAEFEATLFDTVADNIKEDRTPEDLLFQIMLDLGVLLSSKIEETTIAGKKVFNVASGFLIACFDENVTEETIKEIAKQQPYYFVMRDSSMANDSVATNFEQIFATYSSGTVRKVL